MCDFLIKIVEDDDDSDEIASMEYNMAPFVKINKTEIDDRIVFKTSRYPKTHIEVKWTIFADKELKK